MLDSITFRPENTRSLTMNYKKVIEFMTTHDKISIQLLRSINHDHFKILCRLLINAEVNNFNRDCMCQVDQTLKHLNENSILFHSHTVKSI